MSIERFTQVTLVLAIVTLIVGLSACDQIQQVLLPPQPEMPSEMEAPVIPIGVVVDLTGANSTGYGIPMKKGFELARDHINSSGLLGDAKLKLIVKDDQSSRETTVDVVDQLINQYGLSVITGFAVSSQLEMVTQTAQDNEVVLFSSVSSAPVLAGRGNFTFRAGLNSAVLNPPLVVATHEKFGYQTAATIYLHGDTYSRLSDEAFRAALVENGVQVVTTEAYPAGDYEAAITRIVELNPDALFISALTSDISEIMKKARELMPSVHLIVPELTDIEVAASAGDASEGTVTSIGWFSETDTPGSAAFIQSYTEANNGGEAGCLVGTIVCHTPDSCRGNCGGVCRDALHRCNRNSGRAGRYHGFPHCFREFLF
ncbi:Leucine-, isoleucine-, valine-, threonine-, and alanine-binding protein [Geodia barretti]|uniref:Leucine-, isoleucine-, valine-, threonine-, and alanine-binding protein n=1 Tax=Geodia barretti TaxID=519541 RepID=A0AA35TEG1_GEOBA|nr:Leucine-, isoleucine-, valine-, threonine-, and alanine-binding protein [Geodia barretti]